MVIADTYNRGYGCEYYLFGIFNTQEEALKWIIDHPVVCTFASEEDDYEESFNFFEGYDEKLGGVHRPTRSMYENSLIPMTKEEYILGHCRFIRRFNGEPMYIGGYQE